MPDSPKAPSAPLKFDTSMEQAAPDETETEAGLIATLTKISETTLAHSNHATRGVHAKSHGVLHGELLVLEHLPEVLAQGMFASLSRYPVMLRLSTIPGDMLDDKVSTPRGLAIKAVGVDGARLLGSEADVTQDFVLVNGPAFGAPTAKKFLGSLKAVAATTDVAPSLKSVFSTLARGTEKILEAFGTKSPTVLTLGGHPETNILGEAFFSQVPILYGPYIAKVAVVPVSPGLTALTNV